MRIDGAVRALLHHASVRPLATALDDGDGRSISFGELAVDVAATARRLLASRARCVAIVADNSPAWAIVDLAALTAGIPLVPLPLFFTDAQLHHALDVAGVDLIVTDATDRMAALPGVTLAAPTIEGLATLHRVAEPRNLGDTAKVTFTSGTTGAPKGVCLGADAQIDVARSTAHVSRLVPGDRHVALLPLGILLENVAGLYRALVAGATTVLRPLDRVGSTGSSTVDATCVVAALRRERAASAILTPQVLHDMVDVVIDRPEDRPGALRFLGVGGARVPAATLHAAARVGLPAYEGYGLSEATSVVALNAPGALRVGSVGKPLPHCEVRIAGDGEILVRGASFTHYLGDESVPAVDGTWATGDIGHVDEDGFLFVHGRKRNVLITGYGRNVSPEWVEGLLTDGTAIRRAVVTGDGRPHLVAVLDCAGDPRDAMDAVARVNAVLPDYAQVQRVTFAREAFSRANGLLDGKGQPRRLAVETAYAPTIDQLYAQREAPVALITEE